MFKWKKKIKFKIDICVSPLNFKAIYFSDVIDFDSDVFK